MASKTFVSSIFFFLLGLHLCAGQTSNVKGVYWFPGSEFPVSSIDSTIFTHIFCAFADLNSTTYQVTISSSNSAQFKNFTQTVQQKNPSVKTLLSIGGGGANAEDFAAMASQASRRKSFIDSSISLARSNNFHGLDLDWEYPNTTEKFTNFGTLLTEWRAAIAAESTTSGNATLLLTAAVFRSSNYYSLNYPVQAISNSLDWINAMTYDYYGPGWSPSSTAPPAALFNGSSSDLINSDAGIRDWIQSGLSANKIVLGLPFYGYAWRLVNASNHGLFAPANGAALTGDGSITYAQIRNFIKENATMPVHNASVVTDYTFYGTAWIGYDDTQSVSTKVSYAKSNGLLGYFAWHVGADSNWALSQTASIAWGS